MSKKPVDIIDTPVDNDRAVAALRASEERNRAILKALLNLVLTACDAMADTPAADRRLTIKTAIDDGFARITVTDRGVGIPADQLTAAFEPFVTSKKDGLGLGLAISRSIVIAHQGSLIAGNNADRGASFTCVLPATVPASPSPSQ